MRSQSGIQAPLYDAAAPHPHVANPPTDGLSVVVVPLEPQLSEKDLRRLHSEERQRRYFAKVCRSLEDWKRVPAGDWTAWEGPGYEYVCILSYHSSSFFPLLGLLVGFVLFCFVLFGERILG